MKNIKFLIFVCVLSISTILNAQQQVSEKEARNAAINTLYSKVGILKRSSDTEIDTVYSFSKNRKDVLMYEVVFKNRAAILLSGSKTCLPVLGYYIKPEYDNGAIFDATNTNVPCCLHDFLTDYKQEIEWCFTQDKIQLYYEKEWNELQKINSPKATPATIIVESLLNSKWNQDQSNDFFANSYFPTGDCDAYNYYVTKTSTNCNTCSSKRCAAGCVAVAMAQIMYYWKYPVYDLGMAFNWCDMAGELNTYSINYEKERNAVARLIRDCGDAVDMKYCSSNCGSSSTIDKARKALVDHFGYQSDADVQTKSKHANSVWKKRIKSNLDSKRPVFYSGQGSGGHAFVLDGYGSDDLFHINWGWNGNYNSWFTLDSLKPGIHNFNSSQEAIFYIHPKTNQDYCNFEISLLSHYTNKLLYLINLFFFFLGTYIPQYLYDEVPQNIPRYPAVLTSAYSGVIPELNNATVPSSWYTIEPDTTREYVAHKTVILKPGFHAKVGSKFTARIEPCDNCTRSNSPSPAARFTVDDNVEYIFEENDYRKTDLTSDKSKLLNDDLQVYPNPTNGLLTIESIDANSLVQHVEVYNTMNIKVFSCNGNNTSVQEIDISHLPSQIYILKIQINEQIFIKRLILQK